MLHTGTHAGEGSLASDSQVLGQPGAELLAAGAGFDAAPIQVLIAESIGAAGMRQLEQLLPKEAVITTLPEIKMSPKERTALALKTIQAKKCDLLVLRGEVEFDKEFVDAVGGDDKVDTTDGDDQVDTTDGDGPADFSGADKLPSYVLRVGTGMNNIDVAYLKSKKIGVSNTPSINTQSTAELALALLFAVARQIPTADANLKAGLWGRDSLIGTNLSGKTLGIVGVGRIGTTVGTVAKAIGMKVIGLMPSSYVEGAEIPACFSGYVNLEELCRQSDVISLHVPLTDRTRDMIGAEQLALMGQKGPGYLINAARGEVVNQQALLDALNDGTLAGAGIDVFVQDPAPEGSLSDQLARHPRVVATPHIGGQTDSASEEAGKAIVSKAREMWIQRQESRYPVGA